MRNRDDLRRTARAKLARLVGSPAWTLLCFASGAGLGFLALTELRAGPLIAGLVGLATYFLLAFGVPKRLDRSVQGGVEFLDRAGNDPISDPDPRVDLLVEAHQHTAFLAEAQSQLPLAVGEIVNTLHRHAIAIITGVSSEPDKLAPVLRFFTYYLPATADLVSDRIQLASQAGQSRLAEIDQTLTRLIEAFASFEAAVVAPDLQSVDIDMELLDKAMDSDIEALKR
jgi:hypothetical protein